MCVELGVVCMDGQIIKQHESYENGTHEKEKAAFEGLRKVAPFLGVDAELHLGTWTGKRNMSPPFPLLVFLDHDQAAQ